MSEEGRMTFGEHLEELRARIVRAAVAIVLGMIVAWNFREPLFAWLLRPLEVAWYCHARNACEVNRVFGWMLHPARFRAERAATASLPPVVQGFPPEPQVHFPDPTAAFVAYLKIAFIGGLMLALPVVFYQLWAFVAPGLYAMKNAVEKNTNGRMIFFSLA